MAWVRVDDLAPTHAKVIQAGIAFGLFVAGLCYANRYLTDGFIPGRQLAAVLPGVRPRHALTMAVTLVEAGLWTVADDGYQIHDYHDYQPTAAAVRSIRAATHEARVAGGHARAANSQREGGRFTSRTPANNQQDTSGLPAPLPIPTTQDPKNKKQKAKKQTIAVLTDDDDYLATLRVNPAYKHLDLEAELGKATAWYAERGRATTRRSFLGWLNRADRPMRPVNGVPAGALTPKTMASVPALQRFIDRGKP